MKPHSELAVKHPLHLMAPSSTIGNKSPGPKSGQIVNQAGPQLSRWRHAFNYRGKACTIFKRADDKNASYYIKIQRGKKEHKLSLTTPVQAVAVKRAKLFIDDVDGQKWDQIENLKTRHRSSTLEDVLKVYRQVNGLKPRSARNNELAMLTIIKRVTGKEVNPQRVPLTFIDRQLGARYQDTMVAEYCAAAPRDPASQREARDVAFRSSRSTLFQARSLFTRFRHDTIQRYTDAGLTIPTSINEFMRTKLRGSDFKADYNPPSDEVIKTTFENIEKLRDRDPNVYLAFWLAVGAGLRRNELLAADWSQFVERDGFTWISGGIGKNGERINVPVQARAWDILAKFRPENRAGRIIVGWEVAKRLNHWLRFEGWNTQKKMHELRAYIGSLIYRQSPSAAMAFMRHKSIAVTERYYVRYGSAKPVNVL